MKMLENEEFEDIRVFFHSFLLESLGFRKAPGLFRIISAMFYLERH